MTKRGVTTIESVRKQAQDLEDYENAAKLALPIAEALGMPLPTIEEMTEEPKRMSVEVRQITVKMPALIGLKNRPPVRNVNLRLLSREATALAILVDGYASEIYESLGSRDAGPQDFIRYVLSQAADQLGL